MLGARVLLSELGLVATTDDVGRYRFANLAPGGYTLQAAAAGFQNSQKLVQVPAESASEYEITLSS